MEILRWKIASKERYMRLLSKDGVVLKQARAMIVGCAGAGKTTLLERIKGTNSSNLDSVSSTVGLEVHENLFKVDVNKETIKSKSNLLSTHLLTPFSMQHSEDGH